MTQQQQPRLPFLSGLPDLLLLRATRQPSALCCFAALARRAHQDNRRSLLSDLELSTMACCADTTQPTELVRVYEPQSARVTRGGSAVRRAHSDETPPAAPRTPMLEQRSLSATLPGAQSLQQQQQQQHPQHQWLHVASLPSLFGSLLRRRRISDCEEPAPVAKLPSCSNPGQADRQKRFQRQRCTWDVGQEELLAEPAPVAKLPSCSNPGQAVPGCTWDVGQEELLAERVHANGLTAVWDSPANSQSSLADSLNGPIAAAVQSLEDPEHTVVSPGDNGADATGADVVQLRRATLDSRSAMKENTDADTDLVQTYLDSVLESLMEDEDAAPHIDTIDGHHEIKGEGEFDRDIDAGVDIDIYRLLLALEDPIGESTTRDAAATADLGDYDVAEEAELARGPPPLTSAAAAPAAFNVTASELANDEFRYLVAGSQQQPLSASPEGRTLHLASGHPLPHAPLLSDKRSSHQAAADGRKWLHWRRHSYAMNGRPRGALADSGDRPPVLLSTRPPRPPPSPLPMPPRQESTSDRKPVAATSNPRAVVFHSASLAGQAQRLVNFLSSGGQPACRWTQLPPAQGGRCCKWRRSSRRKLVARLLGKGGGGGGRHELAEVKDALRRCATEGHLPVFLLAGGEGATSEAGKFRLQLRRCLSDLEQPGLPFGVVVVSIAADTAHDAAWWASAAGPTSPTLLVAPDGSDGVSPDCCRRVLAATRQCAALAATRRLL